MCSIRIEEAILSILRQPMDRCQIQEELKKKGIVRKENDIQDDLNRMVAQGKITLKYCQYRVTEMVFAD